MDKRANLLIPDTASFGQVETQFFRQVFDHVIGGFNGWRNEGLSRDPVGMSYSVPFSKSGMRQQFTLVLTSQGWHVSLWDQTGGREIQVTEVLVRWGLLRDLSCVRLAAWLTRSFARHVEAVVQGLEQFDTERPEGDGIYLQASDKALRSGLIRLAHAKPEHRSAILAVLAADKGG